MAPAGAAQADSLRFVRPVDAPAFTGPRQEAVVRDGAGFLWAGGSRGLVRFDGGRLRPFSSTAGQAFHVRTLAADPARPADVWVGTEGGLLRYDGNAERVRRVGTPPGREGPDARALAASIRALLPLGDALWVGTDRGLLRLDPAHARFARARAGALPSDSVRALLAPRTAPGELWVGTPRGIARVDAARGTWRRATTSLFGHSVTALAEAGGAVWAATSGGALVRLDPASGRSTRTLRTGVRVNALRASAARPGVVWVATDGRGLLALDTSTGHLGIPLGANALAPQVFDVSEDAAGLLWVATGDGVLRADLRLPRFSPHRLAPEGAPSPGVTALLADGSGAWWVGTLREGLLRVDARAGTRRPAAPGAGLPDPAFALHRDARGALWIGGAHDAALYRLGPDGVVSRHPLGLPSDHVYTIYEAPSRPGVLWVGTDGSGLVAFDTGRNGVRTRYPTSSRSSAPVWAIAELPDEPGVLWVATGGDGLRRLAQEAHTLAPAPWRRGCAPGDSLTALAPGPDGALWVWAEHHGPLRYDRRTGDCQRPSPDGRPRTAAAVALDTQGRLWAGTNDDGLVLYNPRHGVFTRFTPADGLPGAVFLIPAHDRAPGGELLFGGPGGLVAFHPEDIAVDTVGAPVVLTDLRVDGERRPLVRDGDGYRRVTLPHDRNDLAFEFAALDLRDPAKNRYRVRLEGADDAWRSLGTRAEVRYPFLPPGRYTLHVAGTNADGYWSREAATLPFVIRPPLWRTWYFWTLVAVLALGVVVAAYQYRIRQLLRLERTRRRIADDLHDDIGSKVSAVALRLDLAGRNAALPEEERRRLGELAQAARGVVNDLRDAVWFVDAGHDDLPALVARMEQFAEGMLRGRPYTFVRPDTLPPVPLGMETRRHLYLLFKEALHNAVKHGDGPVEVRVACESGRLRLAVADAGPGFDPMATAKRGRGLGTMATRAAALGGALDVQSAPGRGTTVRLTVDLP